MCLSGTGISTRLSSLNFIFKLFYANTIPHSCNPPLHHHLLCPLFSLLLQSRSLYPQRMLTFDMSAVENMIQDGSGSDSCDSDSEFHVFFNNDIAVLICVNTMSIQYLDLLRTPLYKSCAHHICRLLAGPYRVITRFALFIIRYRVSALDGVQGGMTVCIVYKTVPSQRVRLSLVLAG